MITILIMQPEVVPSVGVRPIWVSAASHGCLAGLTSYVHTTARGSLSLLQKRVPDVVWGALRACVNGDGLLFLWLASHGLRIVHLGGGFI